MSLEGAKKLSSLQAAQNLETGKQYSKERERESSSVLAPSSKRSP